MWLVQGRVIHLAAGPGGAVALVMHANGWRMIALDDTGGERWRAEVTSLPMSSPDPNHGFVALSANRAVLSIDDSLVHVGRGDRRADHAGSAANTALIRRTPSETACSRRIRSSPRGDSSTCGPPHSSRLITSPPARTV